MGRGFFTKYGDSSWWVVAGFLWVLVSVAAVMGGNEANTVLPADITLPALFLPGLSVDWQNLWSWTSSVFGHVIWFALMIGIAAWIQHEATSYRFIKGKSDLPFFLVCVIAGSLYPITLSVIAWPACFFWVWSIARLYDIGENGSMVRALFDASFLLALASLFIPRLLWLLPLYWISVSLIQPIRLRGLLASLLGTLAVFWLVGGLSLWWEDWRIWPVLVKDWLTFQFIDWNQITVVGWLIISLLGILLLLIMVDFNRRQFENKAITTIRLKGLLLISAGLLFLWLLAGTIFWEWILMLAIPFSLFFSRYLHNNDNRFTRTLFWLIVGMLVLVRCLPIQLSCHVHG